LLNYVIIERLKKNVEPANILEPGQGGGRQGRCVGINMQKVHFIRQEAQRQSKRVYRVDIDFKIAFTAMSQAALVEVGKDVASALTCKRCTSSNRKLRDRARKFIESTLTLKTPSPPCLKQRSGRWWGCLKLWMLTYESRYMKAPLLGWPQTMRKVRQSPSAQM